MKEREGNVKEEEIKLESWWGKVAKSCVEG